MNAHLRRSRASGHDHRSNDSLITVRQTPSVAALLQIASGGPSVLAEGPARSLAAMAQLREAQAGQMPLSDSDRAAALWLVAGGRLSVGNHDEAHHWRPTRSVHEGEWLDMASAWRHEPLDEQCMAETDCVLCGFPIHDVRSLCSREPDLAQVFLGLLARRVGQLTESTHGLLSKDVLARCAGWLVDALQDSADGCSVLLTQRKRSIASQIGATPETFSRTLRQLREMGAIDVSGYCIAVRDADLLQRLASQAKGLGRIAVKNGHCRPQTAVIDVAKQRTLP
ncbi:MAG TPA: Crp/Fnr family transcriptional regulator, partial [Burkholderiaceae bacterium]|nr:Crp/Fnr family transcriptional regulator [Burkholderiaceae bacterium]